MAEPVEDTPPECPKGCGCRWRDDPDCNDCACDGPCCFGPDWENRPDRPTDDLPGRLELRADRASQVRWYYTSADAKRDRAAAACIRELEAENAQLKRAAESERHWNRMHR